MTRGWSGPRSHRKNLATPSQHAISPSRPLPRMFIFKDGNITEIPSMLHVQPIRPSRLFLLAPLASRSLSRSAAILQLAPTSLPLAPRSHPRSSGLLLPRQTKAAAVRSSYAVLRTCLVVVLHSKKAGRYVVAGPVLQQALARPTPVARSYAPCPSSLAFPASWCWTRTAWGPSIFVPFRFISTVAFQPDIERRI